jgi:hypothetical protein
MCHDKNSETSKNDKKRERELLTTRGKWLPDMIRHSDVLLSRSNRYDNLYFTQFE